MKERSVMRKIEINAEVSSAHGVRLNEVIEVEDDATDEQIDEAVNEVVYNWVSWGWSDAEADAKVTI